MLRAEEAGEKSGVRKTRPHANSGSKSGKAAEANSRSNSNNGRNNAVRNNNRTTPSDSSVGNNSDNSKFSSRRNASNAGSNSVAVRNRSIARANSSSAGNSSDSSKSSNRRNVSSVGNNNANSKLSDRIHDVPKTGAAIVKTICVNDSRTCDGNNRKSSAIETATIVIATTTGVTIATGAPSNSSANCATVRSGSDVRTSSISDAGYSNSNDV